MEGCHLSNYMCEDRNNLVLCMYNFKQNTLRRFYEDVSKLIGTVIPAVSEQRSLVSLSGDKPKTTKMALKLVMRSLEGFRNARGRRIAEFLRSWGRLPEDLVCYDPVTYFAFCFSREKGERCRETPKHTNAVY